MNQLDLIPTTRPRSGNQRMRVKALDGRRAGGQRAAHAGKSFEQLILASARDADCVLVAIKNFARWVKADPAWERMTKMKIKLVQERSPFDFAGVVRSSGAGIFIDAKSMADQASFPVHDAKLVKPHQVFTLESLEAANAFAGFLVRCGRMNDYRFVFASKCVPFIQARKPMPWNHSAWEVLGEIKEGYAVPLKVLFSRYE